MQEMDKRGKTFLYKYAMFWMKRVRQSIDEQYSE